MAGSPTAARALRTGLGRRPVWMSGLMGFCAWMALAYVPWDFLTKPVARDEEVWFGIVLRGWPAKATEPLHWLIYALGTYGFWRMKTWMHPWAALYTSQVGLSMLVWAYSDPRSVGPWSGWLAALAFGWLAAALWRRRSLFREP